MGAAADVLAASRVAPPLLTPPLFCPPTLAPQVDAAVLPGGLSALASVSGFIRNAVTAGKGVIAAVGGMQGELSTLEGTMAGMVGQGNPVHDAAIPLLLPVSCAARLPGWAGQGGTAGGCARWLLDAAAAPQLLPNRPFTRTPLPPTHPLPVRSK